MYAPIKSDRASLVCAHDLKASTIKRAASCLLLLAVALLLGGCLNISGRYGKTDTESLHEWRSVGSQSWIDSIRQEGGAITGSVAMRVEQEEWRLDTEVRLEPKEVAPIWSEGSIGESGTPMEWQSSVFFAGLLTGGLGWLVYLNDPIDFKVIEYDSITGATEEIATGKTRSVEKVPEGDTLNWTLTFGDHKAAGVVQLEGNGTWRVDLSPLRDEIYSDIDLYREGRFSITLRSPSGAATGAGLETLQPRSKELLVDFLEALEGPAVE